MRTGTLQQQRSMLQYLPFFGVFQSNTSQAKYRAAMAQQSVHSMYMRIKVQATPGWVQKDKKTRLRQVLVSIYTCIKSPLPFDPSILKS